MKAANVTAVKLLNLKVVRPILIAQSKRCELRFAIDICNGLTDRRECQQHWLDLKHYISLLESHTQLILFSLRIQGGDFLMLSKKH